MNPACDPTLMLRVVLEADGGSRGNPGPAGYGAVVIDADSGAVLAERHGFLGVTTNNVAEYTALIEGLSVASTLGADQVRVRMDSKLVVEQLSGRYQVSNAGLRPLHARARELAAGFGQISYEWIPRAENAAADRLANRAMDEGAAAGSPVAPADPVPPVPVVAENNNTAWIATDAAPTRLILLRHGVTAYSIEKRFAGRSDLELLPLGLEQAERAAGRVEQLGPIDAIYASPLRRTRQTAAALAERLGLEVQLEPDLIETDYGDWDGYTFDEIRRSEPSALTAWLADASLAAPGGESQLVVSNRVRAGRDRIVAAESGRTVVLVTHVSPIKALVADALAAPDFAVHRMYLAPASISVIDYFSDGPVSLRGYNETAHLADR